MILTGRSPVACGAMSDEKVVALAICGSLGVRGKMANERRLALTLIASVFLSCAVHGGMWTAFFEMEG